MRKNNLSRLVWIATIICLFLASNSLIFSQETITTKDLNRFTWRHIGPWTFSGRITSFAVPRGQSQTYYAATASGGIWKTEDGGIHFEPIFDKYGNMSMGDLAVAPSDPNIIYAGTGEPLHARSSAHGNGMWKSTDGGKNGSTLVWNRVILFQKLQLTIKIRISSMWQPKENSMITRWIASVDYTRLWMEERPGQKFLI